MPRNEYSDLHSAYALENNLSKRSAQIHHKQGHPRWVEFIKRNAIGGCGPVGSRTMAQVRALTNVIDESIIPPGESGKNLYDESALGGIRPNGFILPRCQQPACMQKPEEDRSAEEQVLCEMWLALLSVLHSARTERSALLAAALSHKAVELHKGYINATRELAKTLAASRELIPLPEVVAIQLVTQRLSMCVFAIADHASAISPDNPTRARQEIDRYLFERFQPALAAVEQSIHQIVASAQKRLVPQAEYEAWREHKNSLVKPLPPSTDVDDANQNSPISRIAGEEVG